MLKTSKTGCVYIVECSSYALCSKNRIVIGKTYDIQTIVCLVKWPSIQLHTCWLDIGVWRRRVGFRPVYAVFMGGRKWSAWSVLRYMHGVAIDCKPIRRVYSFLFVLVCLWSYYYAGKIEWNIFLVYSYICVFALIVIWHTYPYGSQRY